MANEQNAPQKDIEMYSNTKWQMNKRHQKRPTQCVVMQVDKYLAKDTASDNAMYGYAILQIKKKTSQTDIAMYSSAK